MEKIKKCKKTKRKKLILEPIITLSILSLILFMGMFSFYLYTYFSTDDTYYVFKGEKVVKTSDTLFCEGDIEGDKAKLALFGIVPLKEVKVNYLPTNKVVPCGTPFGIKIYTNGVLVVNMSDIETDKGSVNPALEAGVKVMDIITHINGTKIISIEQASEIISNCGGKTLTLTIFRDGQTFKIDVSPIKSQIDSSYKVGVWLRDSSAGIGTMTYYEKSSNVFAGLGHAVSDVDTLQVLPLEYGVATKSYIADCEKGKKGTPGKLVGLFYGDNPIGRIYTNCNKGVFGILSDAKDLPQEEMEVAKIDEIKEGKAKIRTTLDVSGPKEYEIKIEKINKNKIFGEKNMVIEIVDKELLAKTNGILQGMSGSPIIQNGKLVGAVTHVFVSDPHKGYGIFAETMIKSSYSKNKSQDSKNEAA